MKISTETFRVHVIGFHLCHNTICENPAILSAPVNSNCYYWEVKHSGGTTASHKVVDHATSQSVADNCCQQACKNLLSAVVPLTNASLNGFLWPRSHVSLNAKHQPKCHKATGAEKTCPFEWPIWLSSDSRRTLTFDGRRIVLFIFWTRPLSFSEGSP